MGEYVDVATCGTLTLWEEIETCSGEGSNLERNLQQCLRALKPITKTDMTERNSLARASQTNSYRAVHQSQAAVS